MAFCSECGNQLRENAKFCSVCGTPQTDVIPVLKGESTAGQNEVTRATVIPVRKWKANVSFVTGLVSVLSPCLCCIHPLVMGIIGLVCGIVSVVFAILSRKDTGGHFCGMAIAGLILAIFGIFISLVVVTFAIVFMVAEPYLPDFDNYWDTYYWIYDTFGKDAADLYEKIMDTEIAGNHTRL